MNKITKFLIFLVAILAVAAYIFFQKNIYSKDVMKLEIIGPNETTMGSEVEYVVKYKNNGNFRLDNPSLLFEPPAFSVVDDKIYQKQILSTDQLGGAIYPGEERTFSFKMRLVGQEGETKIAKATLKYQPKNLKASYESSTTIATVIKSVPLTFEFDLPAKIQADQNFNLRINYGSNVDWLLTDLRAQVEYPSGYEFIESTPKSIDKTEWDVPVLNKGQSGAVDVMGRLSGDLNQAKVFRAKIGMWKDGEFVLLKQIEQGVTIVKPSVSIRQEINGNPKYVAKPGDWLHYEIYFKNISDQEQYNLYMIDKLDGTLFDFNSFKSETGSFSQGDNSIVFDWRKNSKLQDIAPLDEGQDEVWIKLKDDLSNIQKPVLRNRILVGEAQEDFVTKISSKLEVVQRAFYSDEVFGNTGPFPPQVGQATTYTINWQAKNYYSDVSNAKVVSTLPQGVEFAGKIFPEEEGSRFSYNQDTRQFTWNLGDLKAGQGAVTPAANVSFQVSLTPTSGQVGQKPQLIGETRITGDDSWTDMSLDAGSPAIDTSALSDQNMSEDKGTVVASSN